MGGFGSIGFNTSALGGGLDVQGIVQQLLFVEAAPIRRLQSEQSSIQKKVDAFNSLKTKLQALGDTLTALNTADNFSARAATSSNQSILTASADSTATTGSHQIVVNRLALFDNFVSNSTFTTSSDAIGTGSFDLTVGSTTKTITIDATNNTLTGLKNAINDSGANVNANIINDGTGYRLTITSKDSGSSNAISISNNTLTLADATPFSFSRTHNIASTSELDASLTIDGLAVTSSSNSVSGVIEGVTLNLTTAAASTVTLTVSNDTDKVKSVVNDFVNAYNDAYSFINSQFQVNTTTNRGGVLAGDGLLRRIQSDLSSIVSQSVPNLSGSLNNLRAAGIELQEDGTLSVNQSTLDSALSTNFNDIQNLFLATGIPTNSNIVFTDVGSTTQAGNYSVDITQVPTVAQVTSPNVIGATLGVNENLTVTLNSQVSTISLTSGQTLADIVSTINTQLSTDGVDATASDDGAGHLVISSNSKGASQSLTVVSDVNGSGTGFGTTGVTGTGQDVAGTFTDTATGTVLAASAVNGEFLKGTEGGASGLTVQFLGSTTGSFGSVAVSIGIAEQLKQQVDTLTGVTSALNDRVDRLGQEIKDIDSQISDFQDRLDIRQKILTEQFSRADEALRNLSTLQASLNSQLKQLG